MHYLRRVLFVAACGVLAACGRPGGPAVPSGIGSMPGFPELPLHCYTTKIDPTAVKATITFYGWPDNSPPGNAIAHPVIHQVASGSGTYCDPTTFATERRNDDRIPYGIKIYVPHFKQYFIREDLCATGGPKVGHGHNGCRGLWFDLWVGGDADSLPHAVVACENTLTPNAKVGVILYPKPGLPVAYPGPIYREDPLPNGTCYGQPE